MIYVPTEVLHETILLPKNSNLDANLQSLSFKDAVRLLLIFRAPYNVTDSLSGRVSWFNHENRRLLTLQQAEIKKRAENFSFTLMILLLL